MRSLIITALMTIAASILIGTMATFAFFDAIKTYQKNNVDTFSNDNAIPFHILNTDLYHGYIMITCVIILFAVFYVLVLAVSMLIRALIFATMTYLLRRRIQRLPPFIIDEIFRVLRDNHNH